MRRPRCAVRRAVPDPILRRATLAALLVALAAASIGQAQPSATVDEAATARGNEAYCRQLVAHAEASAIAGGCSPSSARRDDATDRCTYHLGGRWTRAYPSDSAARARCWAELDRRIAAGTAARVPASCEVGRLHHDAGAPRDGLTLDQPRGADCRATNGDEGFDADFRCAPGLACVAGRCAPAAPRAAPSSCALLLDLPAALP